MLLKKYLSGTASEIENEKLFRLSMSSAALKEKLEASARVVRQLEDLKLMRQVDTSTALQTLKKRFGKHQVKKDWMDYWQKIAAILLLPLLLLVAFQLFQNKTKPAILSKLAYNEVSTSPGMRSVFELPDGTKVRLNGSTRIRYPMVFHGNERRLQLSGEAYFEVAKDPEKPFIVDIGALEVHAVGTAFNCMAYPDDHLLETTLVEGQVKVVKTSGTGDKEASEYLMKAGQVISYEPDSKNFYLKEGEVDKHISWLSGKFIFRNDPLDVVCQKLGRWFNADFEIQGETLKNYAFTGTFQEESLNEILELISLTSPITYKISKRKPDNTNEYENAKVIITAK